MDCTLNKLINANYSKLKRLVYGKAFQFNIQKDDLLSAVHEKLSIAYSRNLFIAESETQFWAWIHMLVRNEAVDYKRRNKIVSTVDIDEFDGNFDFILGSSYQDYDMKQFTNNITVGLFNYLSKQEMKFYKLFFIDGMKYEDMAKETATNISTVKSAIFRIRAKATLHFGKEYRRLVA